MFQWPPLDVSTNEGRVGPEVNKFEQVSNDDHQMSVAGVAPRSDVHWAGDVSLMSGEGIPYHVTYPKMHVMYLPSPRTE